MAAVRVRGRADASICPSQAAVAARRHHVDREQGRVTPLPGHLTVVRCGAVWEVRDDGGVVSWASTFDAAVAEAARHAGRS
jgi:hypothetical protein